VGLGQRVVVLYRVSIRGLRTAEILTLLEGVPTVARRQRIQLRRARRRRCAWLRRLIARDEAAPRVWRRRGWPADEDAATSSQVGARPAAANPRAPASNRTIDAILARGAL
jgi:hypothetical protein